MSKGGQECPPSAVTLIKEAVRRGQIGMLETRLSEVDASLSRCWTTPSWTPPTPLPAARASWVALIGETGKAIGADVRAWNASCVGRLPN